MRTFSDHQLLQHLPGEAWAGSLSSSVPGRDFGFSPFTADLHRSRLDEGVSLTRLERVLPSTPESPSPLVWRPGQEADGWSVRQRGPV